LLLFIFGPPGGVKHTNVIYISVRLRQREVIPQKQGMEGEANASKIRLMEFNSRNRELCKTNNV